MGAGAAKEERRQQVKKNVQTMGKVSKKRAKPGGTIQGPKILALISRFRLVNHKVRGTTLHECASLNDLEGLQEILKKGSSDIDAVDLDGCTPLMCACSRSIHVDIVKTLIEAKANVNHGSVHKNTPLHFACDWDSAVVVRALLIAKADPSVANCDGLLPSAFAKSAYVKECLEEIAIFDGLVALCIDGLPPNESEGADECAQAKAAIQPLLEKKAELNTQDKKLNTPLMHATWHQHEGIVEALLVMNADPCLPNHSGNTALHFAYETENLAIINSLLEHGGSACSDAQNNIGMVPLDMAKSEYLRGVEEEEEEKTLVVPANAETIPYLALTKAVKKFSKGQMELIQELLKKKADVNEIDKKKSTPIMHAIWNQNQAIVELLLEQRADPLMQNLRMNTALHFAFERNNENIINLLLTYGAASCMSIKNSMGKVPVDLTKSEYLRWEQIGGDEGEGAGKLVKKKKGGALTRAVKKEDIEKVRALLKQKADPDETDAKGSTPIIHSAWRDGIIIVEQLLIAKADVNASNSRKNTALHFAYEKNNRLLVQYLLDNGASKSLQIKNLSNKTPEQLTNKLYLRKFAAKHLQKN